MSASPTLPGVIRRHMALRFARRTNGANMAYMITTFKFSKSVIRRRPRRALQGLGEDQALSHEGTRKQNSLFEAISSNY